MAGSHSRRKGRQGENELVGYLKAHGFDAQRISEAGSPGPDVRAFNGRVLEVKRRATPPSKTIEKWLRDVALVAYRVDQGEWTITLRLDEFMDLLDEADNGELWE